MEPRNFIQWFMPPVLQRLGSCWAAGVAVVVLRAGKPDQVLPLCHVPVAWHAWCLQQYSVSVSVRDSVCVCVHCSPLPGTITPLSQLCHARLSLGVLRWKWCDSVKLNQVKIRNSLQVRSHPLPASSNSETPEMQKKLYQSFEACKYICCCHHASPGSPSLVLLSVPAFLVKCTWEYVIVYVIKHSS